MKNKIIPISLIIAITMVSCEKENTDLDYDCYKSNITYTESNEFQYQEMYYYHNNLLVRTDCSPRYIWNYEYDNRDNLIKFESEKGSYFLYNYDSENRCVQSEQYVEDSLYLKTHKFYLDTLLMKEIYLIKNDDTLSNVDYYYNNDNQLDSVISNKSGTYHYYTFNDHTIIKFNNSNNKYFESITTYENGLTSKYEEFYYNENSEVYKSFIENKNYDDDNNLVKIVIEQFDLYSNSNHYDEIGYSYDSMGKKIKSESYNANGTLLNYIEYNYDGDNLVKKQSFDYNGNKTGYTIVENNCNN